MASLLSLFMWYVACWSLISTISGRFFSATALSSLGSSPCSISIAGSFCSSATISLLLSFVKPMRYLVRESLLNILPSRPIHIGGMMMTNRIADGSRRNSRKRHSVCCFKALKLIKVVFFQ